MMSNKMLAIFGRGLYKGIAVLPIETVKKVCNSISLMKELKIKGVFIPNAVELRGELVYIDVEDLENSIRFVTAPVKTIEEFETLWGEDCELGDCPFKELADGEKMLKEHLNYINMTSIKKKEVESKVKVEEKKVDKKNIINTTSSFSSPLKEQLRKEIETFEKKVNKVLQQEQNKNEKYVDTSSAIESSLEELAEIIANSLFKNL